MDVKCMLKMKSCVGAGRNISTAGRGGCIWVWCGHNTVRDNCESDGIGLQVKKNIRSKLLLRIEGAVWMELHVVEGNNMTFGVVYVNPEGVGVQESEMLFEMMKAKVIDCQKLFLRY